MALDLPIPSPHVNGSSVTRLCAWLCRRKCRVCSSCCLGTLALFVLYVTIMTRKYKCSQRRSEDYIHSLCRDYKYGRVAGSMCSDLCDKANIVYDSCVSYHAGKTVMLMKCTNCESRPVKAVLKVAIKDERPWPEEALRKGYTTVEKLVTDTIFFQSGLNMSSNKDILSYVWGMDYNEFISANQGVPDIKSVAGESILLLTNQQEYLLMRLLHEHSFMPKIYGTCGAAYFLEFTQSLDERSLWFSGKTFSWDDQVKVAVKLVDMVQTIDTVSPQQLHLCDIKPDNFGMRADGEVTLIDVDCAMFHNDLYGQYQYSNCTKDEDCDFFDCKGRCQFSNKTCLPERFNNNLQSLCEDVFIYKAGPFNLGILRDPPIHSKTEVDQVLRECAYPAATDLYDPSRGMASRAVAEKLKKVLIDSTRH